MPPKFSGLRGQAQRRAQTQTQSNRQPQRKQSGSVHTRDRQSESDTRRSGNSDEKWSAPSDGHSRFSKYLPARDRHAAEERKFKAEDFYVAATDAKGHSEKTWVKLHPGMWNEVLMLISRGYFPFDTPQSVIRMGIQEVLGMCYLLERHGGVPNYNARLKAISRIQQQVQQNIDFGESYRQVSETVKDLLRSGQDQQAAVFLFDVLHEAQQIPERAWRDMYVGMIKRDWGAIIKGSPVKVMRPRRGRADGDEEE